MKNRTLLNSAANAASKIWAILSLYLFVPLYIHFLGEEAYGLVSFFTTMSAALNLLGLGLSSTLRREFALDCDGGHAANLRKYRLLRDVELLFGAVALLIAAGCLLLAPQIAGRWLHASALGTGVVTQAVRLMAVSIVLQLVANLYFGALLGLGRQVLANSLHIAWSAAKALGSVAVLALIAADVRGFYFWHIIVDAVYILVLRRVLLRQISGEGVLTWRREDLALLKTVWRYAGGLALISLVAFVNTQFDRIIISGSLSLTELGAYSSCGTLGQLITMVSSAVGTAVFPVFASKQGEELKAVFERYYHLVAVGVCAMGMFVAVYSSSLLLFWTRSDVYAGLTAGSSSLVILGSMFVALQEVPYAFVLAQGDTSLNLKLGLTCLPLVALGMFWGVRHYGLMGAAAVYCGAMALQTAAYIFMVYRKYFHSGFRRWLLRDTMLPMVCCLLLALLSRLICTLLGLSGLPQILFAGATGAASLAVVVFALARKELRALLRE